MLRRFFIALVISLPLFGWAATNFPSGLDNNGTLFQVSAGQTVGSTHHNNLKDAVIALETKVGINSSAVTSSLDYLLKNPSSVNPGHTHTGTSLSGILESTITDGGILARIADDETISGAWTFSAAGTALTVDNDAAVTGALTAGSFSGDGSAITALDAGNLATGLVPLARGGTHTDLSATGGANRFLKQLTTGGDITVAVISDADVPNTITLDNITQITTRSHSALQNLTTDDHTQYALLAGRSTNQTFNGATTSGGTLTLSSTANGTKGKILFGTSAYDEVNNRLGLGTASPSSDFHLSKTSSGSSVEALVQNQSNTSSSNARLRLTVAGTSGGDPYITTTVTGGNSWTFGLDTSDSSNFKIAASTAVETNTRLTITQAGAVTINALSGGGTQCLQIDNNGTISATGGACGSGSGDITNGGNTTGSSITIGTNDTNALIFETDNSPRGRFSSGGDFLINTTTSRGRATVLQDPSVQAGISVEASSDQSTFSGDFGAVALYNPNQTDGNFGTISFLTQDTLSNIYEAARFQVVNLTHTDGVESAYFSFAGRHAGAQASWANITGGSGGSLGIGVFPAFDLHVEKTAAGGDVRGVISNADNTTGTSNAYLGLTTGGASSGDPFVNWVIAGESDQWSMGLDNSDSNKLIIAKAAGLGSNKAFTIDSSLRVGIGTTAPSALLDILRSSEADILSLQTDGNVSGASEVKTVLIQRDQETTDNTPTTINTFTTASNRSYQVEVKLTARRSDSGTEAASYVCYATFRNTSGTLAQVSTTSCPIEQEDTSGWSVGIAPSGTDILVQVTGENAKTIDWSGDVTTRIGIK